MKTLHPILVAAALCLVVCTVFADNWLTDYDKALAQAKSEKKLVLLEWT